MYFFETQVEMHDVPVSSEESQDMKAEGAAKLREYFWAMICLIGVTCFSILTGTNDWRFDSSLEFLFTL